MRERDDAERQARRPRLRFEERPPHAVHRHAIGCLVDRREQRRTLETSLLSQEVQHPRAVLAGGPGDEDLHRPIYRKASGWSVRAINSVACATRGPGIGSDESVRMWIRPVRTAGTDASADQADRSASIWSGFRACRNSTIASGARCNTSSDVDLHRLAFDVGEDVVRARGLEHVVKEADATAGEYSPQRERVTPEHEQRLGPRPTRHLAADRRESRFEIGGDPFGRLASTEAGPERPDRGHHAREVAMLVQELLDARAFELQPQIGLRAVDEDQIRLQRQDPLEIGIQESSDPRQRRTWGGYSSKQPTATRSAPAPIA